MKHVNRWMSWALALVMMVSMVVLTGAGCAESDSDSEAVNFEPDMIQYFGLSASDFTKSSDMRGLFAFMLAFEFSNQQEEDFDFDFSKPTYIGVSDSDIGVAAFGTEDGYVLIFYQDDPLNLAYSISDSVSSLAVRLTLEASCESVWEVPASDIQEQGQNLVDALKE